MTGNARRLRRTSTDAEMKLWLSLRDRRLDGFKFVRQEAIGPYVADFVCRDQKLVIEVDGGQHADSETDRARDAYMNKEGFRVLRFWNNDVLSNRDGVLEAILSALQTEKN
jgi:very-short-patch-repair endonuclease